MSSFFETKIEYLKGIGPQKAALLNTELRLFTYADLIQHYPFRYEDRSVFLQIRDITEELQGVQLIGRIRSAATIGEARKKRLVAEFYDNTGSIELIWFQGHKWILAALKHDVDYVLYGKPNFFGRKISIAHPELELYSEAKLQNTLHPVYSTTEKLRNRSLDSKGIGKLQERLVELAYPHINETLPEHILKDYKLIPKKDAIKNVHFPVDYKASEQARKRLKFEELFYVQLKLLSLRSKRKNVFRGQIFKDVPTLTDFYSNHLPFDLTKAQKRVIREIYRDMSSGKQMNRLLQGDVGSGKTIVAFICTLIALDSGAQACLMAPTEILAQQHYAGLKEFADKLNLKIAILTGSTKQRERKILHQELESGAIQIIIGTHALLEDVVKFKNLGLVIIDEQHRFGVAQRAKMWKKNQEVHPHVLVMTATPIPRTLAMTLYGDLDLSVIDELPAGRKPISTVHRYDKDRLKVFGFMRKQIDEGRQVYVVYPLIEESETLDLKDLNDGYESIRRAFPDVPLSIVHGRMKAADKDYEMQRFVKAETKIMVATTVIEVGVNVPNASVMVIENAERFGLSQLHQLRGRVGRGAEQSYCILMTGEKLTRESKIRLETMVRTNNGFEIADVDLRLRGPGDLAGTQQSGVLDLLIADLSQDAYLLHLARDLAMQILENDPELMLPENYVIRRQVEKQTKHSVTWGRIS